MSYILHSPELSHNSPGTYNTRKMEEIACLSWTNETDYSSRASTWAAVEYCCQHIV